MAKVCELSGISPDVGHKVSHSNIKTKIRWLPNLKKKRYFIPELRKTVTLQLSTRAIRTIDHMGGISVAILHSREDRLSKRLLRLKGELQKQGRRGAAPKPAQAE